MGNVTACGASYHLEDLRNISSFFPFLYLNSLESYILSGFTIIICMIGLAGNGIVLWFLCSHRTSSTFITNLSVADFGVLFALSTNILLFFFVFWHGRSNYAIYIVHLCLHNVYVSMHYASAIFLMTISFDRCVAIIFPLWHRIHRSKSLLIKTSAFLWFLSCLIAGLSFFFRFCHESLMINTVSFSVICILMVFSTAVLSSKVYCSLHLRRRGKLLTAILIALFFFIATMWPRGLLKYLINDKQIMHTLVLLLKPINSCINPIIYFSIGRQKAGPSMQSWKAVFQKFFKEEEYTGEEGETSTNMTPVELTS